MVELNNKSRILLFVSSMILSVHALDISFFDVYRDFQCKTKIKLNVGPKGDKSYGEPNLYPMYYKASNESSIVIVHVVSITRYEEIVLPKAAKERRELAETLKKGNYELVVLGIENCVAEEVLLIHYFIWDIIFRQGNTKSKTLLLGEPEKEFLTGKNREKARWEVDFFLNSKFERCERECLSFLEKCLRESFPKMEHNSKRSVLCRMKHFSFYEYVGIGSHYLSTTKWPLSVENGKYIPIEVISPTDTNQNILSRYPEHTYHILIVSGTDYEQIKTTSKKIGLFEQLKIVREKLLQRGHILFIMACFNFDWSDIDMVPQIIWEHSKGFVPPSQYKVFTIGIGMFATLFENPCSAGGQLLRTQDDIVLKFAEKCNKGAALSESRSFEIFDLNAMSGSRGTPVNFTLLNGRYNPQGEFSEFRLSTNYPNQNFAFIVVNSTEIRVENFLGALQAHAMILRKDKNIVTFLIETIQWNLYDLHIIPEWVEKHRGDVHPNRITILGYGKCDTFYQYSSRLYQVSYTPSIILPYLNTFRHILMGSLENKDKEVIVLKPIFDSAGNSKFDVQKHPMHTINGFYDPVRLSKKDIFETTNGKKIMFLILGANRFNPVENGDPPRVENLSDLGFKMHDHYPVDTWAIYLVVLRNFGDNDSHLFAEFLQWHTIDTRPLKEFLATYMRKGECIEFAYKDTAPIPVVKHITAKSHLIPFWNSFNTVFDLIKDL